MGDESAQSGAAAEAGTAIAAGAAVEAAVEDETPKLLTRDDLKALVEEALKGYSTKINGELAGLRKRLEGGHNGAGATIEQRSTTEEPQLTRADLDAHREIGRIEGQLPADLQAELAEDTKGLSLAEAVRAYRTAAKVLAKTAIVKAGDETSEKTGGETPKTSRSAVPAKRETAPRPKTLEEYVKLAKADPKRKAALDADDDFDPSELPRS